MNISSTCKIIHGPYLQMCSFKLNRSDVGAAMVLLLSTKKNGHFINGQLLLRTLILLQAVIQIIALQMNTLAKPRPDRLLPGVGKLSFTIF